MAEQDPNETNPSLKTSVVDATFGVFQGEPVLDAEEERRQVRRARDEYLARKHAPGPRDGGSPP